MATITSGNNTALHDAVKRRDIRRMKLALERGADPSFCEIPKRTILHEICELTGDDVEFYDAFKEYCHDNHCTVDLRNKKDEFGNSQLHSALFCRNFGLARELIDEGTDKNIQNNSGQTPLHVYCSLGNDETDLVVQILLSRDTTRVDLNIVDVQNKTPLDVAIENNMIKVTELLLEYNLNQR
ncbi:hypothetical protein TKK_0013553 [Trichogramma kaykai]